MPVDPRNLDLRRYVIVDPQQTDPEQYATAEDEDPPAGVFPYGVMTDDGRVLWGVVSRAHLPYLLDHIELGGCYQFWALDGSEPPDWVSDAGQGGQTGEGEPAHWRDAYTVEFSNEQEA